MVTVAGGICSHKAATARAVGHAYGSSNEGRPWMRAGEHKQELGAQMSIGITNNSWESRSEAHFKTSWCMTHPNIMECLNG